MSAALATVLGLPYDTVLLLITVIATIGTFGAMFVIVFLAWAPHYSGAWAKQLGVGFGNAEDDAASSAD